jgi:hypothetical protein
MLTYANACVTGQQLLQTSDNIVEWFHSKGPPSIIAWHNKHGADAHANAIPPLPTLQVLSLLALLVLVVLSLLALPHNTYGTDAHANAILSPRSPHSRYSVYLLYCYQVANTGINTGINTGLNTGIPSTALMRMPDVC